MNKLEQKAIRQLNLNEGLISILANYFIGSKEYHAYMRLLKRMKKDDPELAAELASFHQNWKIIKQSLDRLCKENPNADGCK